MSLTSTFEGRILLFGLWLFRGILDLERANQQSREALLFDDEAV
jgi:hypothetical protein